MQQRNQIVTKGELIGKWISRPIHVESKVCRKERVDWLSSRCIKGLISRFIGGVGRVD